MNIDDKAFEFFGIKSTNYQKNTILANYSSGKGGYLGISLDQNDDILEQSVANIAVILKTGEFVTPPASNNILFGTTLQKVLKYCANNPYGCGL